MERIHREQPMVEDVKFIPVVEQMGIEYRGMKGGKLNLDELAEVLPVDTMEGLQVSTMIPEGFYAKPATEEAPTPDEPTAEENL